MEDFRIRFSSGDGSSIPLIAGILLLWLSWYLWRQQLRFTRGSVQTTGELIGYKATEHNDSEYSNEPYFLYAPIIRYTALDGSTREFTDQVASGKQRHAPGDVIRIRYHQHENQASIDSFLSIYGATIGVTVMGLICLIVGIFG